MDMDQHIPFLESLLRARGLRMARVNPTEDLLLPPSGTDEDMAAYRVILDHYAARLMVKEVIKAGNPEEWARGRRSVERFCDSRSFDGFLARLSELGVLRYTEEGVPVPVRQVRSFGSTYEWYTAALLSSDFMCPSAWGVTFQDYGTGGDHDVVASLSGLFLYLEVKTAPPKHIEAPEINAFVQRLFDLAPDIAVFNNDTHLRMKDKVVPLLETSLENIHGKRGERVHFKRLEREIFHFQGAIYVVNSKPDLRRNLNAVFRHYFRCGSRVLEVMP